MIPCILKQDWENYQKDRPNHHRKHLLAGHREDRQYRNRE